MQQGSYPIGTRTINVLTDNATGVVTGATCDIPLNLLAQAIQQYLGLTLPIGVSGGGTGATTAAQARVNLGLGSIATQNSNAVSLTGGSIDGTSIGASTPSTGAFTSLTSSSPISVSSGGTGASTFTAHGVLLGEGSGAIVATGTGTSGQPLLSGGAAADPAYGNLGVAAGGTGRTTLTARSVLIGEGTSAVNFAVPSTAGQALISTGASSDPTFGIPTGALLNVQVFTASGTYTATTGTNSVIVELVGGGGGGGGTPATAAGQSAVGAGGGGGAFARIRATSGFNGVTVTVGSAGTGASGAGGTSGGTSSFGTLASCPGGAAGGVGTAIAAAVIGNVQQGGATPTISGATTLMSSGGYTSGTGAFIITAGAVQAGGSGGDSPFGAGGAYGTSGAGGAALGRGAGGGGAGAGASTGALAGGNGAAGMVVVYEYA